MNMSALSTRSLAAAAALCALLLAGCGADPPQFRSNMVEWLKVRPLEPVDEDDADAQTRFEEELKIWQNDQQTVANVLVAMFGTPDDPFVLPETGLNLEQVKMASGPSWTEGLSQQQGLFRQWCAHCHGVTGDGMGPTAAFLNPYPRDYRQGIFKFKSTLKPDKPTTHNSQFTYSDGASGPVPGDLKRALIEGIAGTAMPSFRYLPDDQLEALVEYVKYLSIRGQVEIALVQELGGMLDEEKEKFRNDPNTMREKLLEVLEPIAASWKDAQSQIIEPTPPPADMDIEAAIVRGSKLFHGKRANCFSCHGPEGLGDGQTTDYDDWSKTVNSVQERFQKKNDQGDVVEQSINLVAEGYALAPRNIIPRNLRQGIFRGGRRPIDIFRKIYTGINGTPMPGVGGGGDGKAGLTDEEIWDLVWYVRNRLPYEYDRQFREEMRNVDVGVVQ